MACRIGAGGGCVKLGETFWNALKGGRTEKRVGETKILKWGQAGSRGGYLKKDGGDEIEPPYELWLIN